MNRKDSSEPLDMTKRLTAVENISEEQLLLANIKWNFLHYLFHCDHFSRLLSTFNIE